MMMGTTRNRSKEWESSLKSKNMVIINLKQEVKNGNPALKAKQFVIIHLKKGLLKKVSTLQRGTVTPHNFFIW